jgi:hypothetical protein
MDLTPLYPWLRYIHVAAAFGLAFAHGVSAYAAFAIRGTRDRGKLVGLLELSGTALGLFYLSLLTLLVAGIVTGLVIGWRNWMWAAIGLLLVVVIGMYAMATRYYAQIRTALGLPAQGTRKDAVLTPASDAELDALLNSRRPEQLTALGVIGFLLILYLMMFKPF